MTEEETIEDASEGETLLHIISPDSSEGTMLKPPWTHGEAQKKRQTFSRAMTAHNYHWWLAVYLNHKSVVSFNLWEALKFL